MLKSFIVLWLVLGAVLAAAYFTPPVQRRLRQARAEEYLHAAQQGRARAAALWEGADHSLETLAEATAQWLKVLEAADAALAAFPDPTCRDALLARVLRAEALAQTGQVDVAYGELLELEKLAVPLSDADLTETVQATLARTTHQIAQLLRKESNDDASWIRFSEIACLYYQDLLKNAPDEATRDVYRRNLACVVQFRYGIDDEIHCWSMPPVLTVDCKKKLRHLQRQPPPQKGGGGNKEFNKPTSDSYDKLRQDAIRKTREGEDTGK